MLDRKQPHQHASPESITQLENVVLGPIVASIGLEKDHRLKGEDWKGLKKHAQDVDYGGSPEALVAAGMMNGGIYTFTFSSVDESPKFSWGYMNCTGLAAVGVDQKTGKNISILTHQDPSKYLENGKEVFVEKLRTLLRSFKERVVPGTVDVTLFGGFPDSAPETDIGLYEDYVPSMQVLANLVSEELGINPHISIGPSEKGDVSALLDAKHRRLYLSYPSQEDTRSQVSFNASELPEQAEKFKRENLSSG